MEKPKTFAERLVELRTAKKWSRPELGRKMGIAIDRKAPFSGEAIRQYETGLTGPKKDALRALSILFGISEAELLFGSTPVAAQPQSAYSVNSPEVDRLIRAFTWLTDAQRAETLGDLEAKAATNRAITKELGPRFEFTPDHHVAKHLKPVPAKVGKKHP